MEYKRKRLNLAVKREFQMWLLARVSGVVIVSSLVATLILYFYARQEISANFYSAHIQIRRVSDLLLPVMAAGAFVSLLSGIALAFFLPQKIAGPLYRIQHGLQSIGEGNLTEHITLRSNDTLLDLAVSLNDATAGLRTRVQDVKALQKELDQIIAVLAHQEMAAVAARQNNALERLRTE